MLLSNVDGDSTSLRIDVVSASAPKGSSIDIAKINENAEAAYNAAKFAEI